MVPLYFCFPVLIVIVTVLAFGVGVLVAALAYAVPRPSASLLGFGIQLLMHASPVIFPLSLVPEGSTLRMVIELNPMAGIIEGFRAALLCTPMDLGLLPYSAMAAVVMLLVGTAVFQRVQRSVPTWSDARNGDTGSRVEQALSLGCNKPPDGRLCKIQRVRGQDPRQGRPAQCWCGGRRPAARATSSGHFGMCRSMWRRAKYWA